MRIGQSVLLFHKQSSSPSSRADVLVSNKILHSLDLAFVRGHLFVVNAVSYQVFLAVVDQGPMLQLERAQCLQRLQQNLEGTGRGNVQSLQRAIRHHGVGL